jgi:hypothetical protein
MEITQAHCLLHSQLCYDVQTSKSKCQMTHYIDKFGILLPQSDHEHAL